MSQNDQQASSKGNKERRVVLSRERLTPEFMRLCEAVGFGPPKELGPIARAYWWLKVPPETRERIWGLFPKLVAAITERAGDLHLDKSHLEAEVQAKKAEVLRLKSRIQVGPNENIYLDPKGFVQAFGLTNRQGEALRKRLQRWRNKNDDGWYEVANPRPREARFRYRVEAVKHIVESLIASGIRPAKKS